MRLNESMNTPNRTGQLVKFSSSQIHSNSLDLISYYNTTRSANSQTYYRFYNIYKLIRSNQMCVCVCESESERWRVSTLITTETFQNIFVSIQFPFTIIFNFRKLLFYCIISSSARRNPNTTDDTHKLTFRFFFTADRQTDGHRSEEISRSKISNNNTNKMK